MPSPIRRVSAVVPFALLAFAACSTVSDDLSKQLLLAPRNQLATPADLGLDAEWVDVPLHSEASLTGWWLPNQAAHGRTVVLFHDANTNVSVLHPWYSFLHAAGYQVLAFDPRGYGRSKGTATLQAWTYDPPAMLDWLEARPDVDPAQIAYFGIGLGSDAALWWAVRRGRCRALVLEHLPSLRAMLREGAGGDGNAADAVRLGLLEFAGLPDDLEPDDNAVHATTPALFVATENEPARDRNALLRTLDLYTGPAELWLVPGTRTSPHVLLTHDGEYQQQIVGFLDRQFAAAPSPLQVTCDKAADASDGQAWYEVHLAAATPAGGAATPVEVAIVLPDGSTRFARTRLDNGHGKVRVKLPTAPRRTSAVVIHTAVDDPTGAQPFALAGSARSRSAATIEPLWPRIEELRQGQADAASCGQLAADLQQAMTAQPFAPELTAELADVYARLGKMLLAAAIDEPARTEARAWLQRAVEATPAKPQLHYWPGLTTSWGFAYQEEIDEAKRLLTAK